MGTWFWRLVSFGSPVPGILIGRKSSLVKGYLLKV